MYLSLGGILEYDSSSGLPPSDNFSEGEQILNSRLLPFCGRIADDFQGYKLVAYCEQDSNRDKCPYEIRGVINSFGKILRMSCNCEKESTEKCKHVFATLLYCNRHNLDELNRVSNKEIEAMQNTDFTPKPLLEYECFKKQLKPKKRRCVTKEQEGSIKHTLYEKYFEEVLIKEEPE